MNKISKFYDCLCSKCLFCCPFYKNKKFLQQNYITLQNDQQNSSEVKVNTSQCAMLVEATTLPSKEISNDERKNNENVGFYGKNEIERGLVQNSQAIIDDLFEKIYSSYEGWEIVNDENIKYHKLKMYLKSYLKENKNRVNIFRLEHLAPCSAKEFIIFHNNVDESRKMIGKNIDHLEAFVEFGPENCYKLMYSKYKKILTASPRDIVYIKHYRTMEKESKNLWIEYSQSVENETYQISPDKVRGKIILSGQIVEDINEGECLVKSWIEVDFKLSLPLMIIKPASVMEMRSFVERCDQRIKELNKKDKSTDENKTKVSLAYNNI